MSRAARQVEQAAARRRGSPDAEPVLVAAADQRLDASVPGEI